MSNGHFSHAENQRAHAISPHASFCCAPSQYVHGDTVETTARPRLLCIGCVSIETGAFRSRVSVLHRGFTALRERNAARWSIDSHICIRAANVLLVARILEAALRC